MSAYRSIVVFWRRWVALIWFPVLLLIPRRAWVRFLLGVFFFAALTPWAVLRRWGLRIGGGWRQTGMRAGWTEIAYSTSDRRVYEGQR